MNPAFLQFQKVTITTESYQPLRDQHPLFKAWGGEKRKMSQAFSNNNNSFNINNYTTPDDEAKILAWLSPLEPWIRHRDIGAQRLDSVGGWVLETKEFKCWHNGGGEDESKKGTLFCEGN